MDSQYKRISFTLPEAAVEQIDLLCGGSGGKGGADGRSAWIRKLVLSELGIEEETDRMQGMADKKRDLPNPYRGNRIRTDFNEGKDAEPRFFRFLYQFGTSFGYCHTFYYPKDGGFPTAVELKKKIERSTLIYDFVFLGEKYRGDASFQIGAKDDLFQVRSLEALKRHANLPPDLFGMKI